MKLWVDIEGYSPILHPSAWKFYTVYEELYERLELLMIHSFTEKK